MRQWKYAQFLFSGELVLYNIFYDVSTLCTSIVAQDSQGMYVFCFKGVASEKLIFHSSIMSLNYSA